MSFVTLKMQAKRLPETSESTYNSVSFKNPIRLPDKALGKLGWFS